MYFHTAELCGNILMSMKQKSCLCVVGKFCFSRLCVSNRLHSFLQQNPPCNTWYQRVHQKSCLTPWCPLVGAAYSVCSSTAICTRSTTTGNRAHARTHARTRAWHEDKLQRMLSHFTVAVATCSVTPWQTDEKD